MTGDVERSPSDGVPAETEVTTRTRAIDGLARQAASAVADAGTREDLESAVCSLLDTLDAYAGVWVGRCTATNDRVTIEEVAGLDVDSATPSVDDLPAPVEAAVADNDAHTGPYEPVRGTVLGDALRAAGVDCSAVAAIPLRYEDTIYGLVAVHSTDPFTPDEVAALADLVSLFGFAVSAVETRKLLTADSAVELDLTVADSADPLIAIAEAFDCRLTVMGLVPSNNSEMLCYVRLDGVDAGSVAERLADHAADVRAVSAEGNVGAYELRLGGPCVVGTLAGTGGVVQDLSVEGDTARLTVEVAPDADVRAVVEALEGAFEGVTLLAQRQITRSAVSRSRFRSSLAADLTDQQRVALEAAYAANYFEWPRGTTAEELAASLGIASPTFHQHLRAAKRKLLDAYFEEAGGPPRHPD